MLLVIVVMLGKINPLSLLIVLAVGFNTHRIKAPPRG